MGSFPGHSDVAWHGKDFDNFLTDEPPIFYNIEGPSKYGDYYMEPTNGKVEFSVIMLHGFNYNADFWIPYFNNAKNAFVTRFVFP